MDMEWLDLNTVVFATSSLVGSLVYYYSTRNAEAIQNLQDAPNREVGTSLQSLLKGKKFVPYVSIRGGVKELGPQLIKTESGHVGVIQMISLNEHSMRRYGNGFWGGSVREIGTTLNDVPFGLKSISDTNPMIVEIVDPLQAVHENLLSSVSTKFTPSTPGFASTVMGYFMGNASTGIETTEKLLTLDTNITAIGQLSVTSGSEKVRLSTPMDTSKFPYILSTYPLEHIIERMANRSKGLRVIAYMFYGVAAIFMVRKAMKLWEAYERKQMRERILRERLERTERTGEGVNRVNNDNVNSSADLHFCIICLTNPREVILLPCGHVVACLDCLERLNGACPVCRSNYSRTHAAYIS